MKKVDMLKAELKQLRGARKVLNGTLDESWCRFDVIQKEKELENRIKKLKEFEKF